MRYFVILTEISIYNLNKKWKLFNDYKSLTTIFLNSLLALTMLRILRSPLRLFKNPTEQVLSHLNHRLIMQIYMQKC